MILKTFALAVLACIANAVEVTVDTVTANPDGETVTITYT